MNMNTNPYLKYQENAVNTASPIQIVIKLYDGAIRFTKQAQLAIQAKDIETANMCSQKAQAIINELIACLNLEISFSKELVAIYDYILHLLIQGNIKKDEKKYAEVLEHLGELRESWKQLANLSLGNRGIE